MQAAKQYDGDDYRLFTQFAAVKQPLRGGLLSRSPRAERPASAVGFGAAALARFASEAPWAGQDENLQPDRYVRQRRLFDR